MFHFGPCSAKVKKGTPCPIGAMRDSDLCHIHAPRVHQRGQADVMGLTDGTRRKIPYREYLKSKGWEEKRQKRLTLDAHKCVLCGSGSRLEVHHVSYDHLGHESPQHLRTLCHECHAEVTAQEKLVGRTAANLQFKPAKKKRRRRPTT